jgi:hypothetical protein
VFVEPGEAFGGLTSLLNGPSASSDADQLAEWDRVGE